MNEFLSKELDEINNYTRNNIQLLIYWYTFFLSLSFMTGGYFGSEIAKGEMKEYKVLIFIIIYFIVQNILSIIGLGFSIKELETSNKRSEEISSLLNIKSTLPKKYYKNIIVLFQITIITLTLFWICFLYVIQVLIIF
jgi:hypothetical protein